MYKKKKWNTKKQPNSSKDFDRAGLTEWTGNVEASPSTNAMFLNSEHSNMTHQPLQENSCLTILDEDVFFGYLTSTIVGLRYYSGMVTNQEMVSLQREPQNAYDRNAIRVNNVRGEQVGHIKRNWAMAIAPIMDSGLVRVEGLVRTGSSATYSMPVTLSFWGDAQNKGVVQDQFRRLGYALNTKVGGSRGYLGKEGYAQPKSHSSIVTSSQIKDELDNLFENLKDVDQTSEINQSPAITTKLFKHQKQALCWMMRRENGNDLPPFWKENKMKDHHKNENSVYENTLTNFHTTTEPRKFRGGILADDMGLGKTLVVISLVVGNGCENKPLFKAEDSNGNGANVNSEKRATKPGKKATSRKVKAEKNVVDRQDFAVDVHRNEVPAVKSVSPERCEKRPKRNTKRPAKYDDDIVGYDIVAPVKDFAVDVHRNEVPAVKSVSPERCEKRPKRNTKRPAKYDDDIVGYDIVAPVKEKRPKRKAKVQDKDNDYLPESEIVKGTFVGLPDESVVFTKEKSQPTLIVCPLSVISGWEVQLKEHLHPSAPLNLLVYHGAARTTCDKDLLNQQDIVITTYQTLAQELKKCGCLFDADWLRVVLDEGHVIRNANALQTKACCALKAQRKWVLSGTPIQNSIKDLYPIIWFLGLEPFDQRTWWRRVFEHPLLKREKIALTRLQALVGAICMRRTKHQMVDGKPVIELPSKEVVLSKVELSPEERLLYNRVSSATKKTIFSFIENDSVMMRYAEVMVILMRLRQICCHPSLVKNAMESLTGDSGNCVPEEEAKMLVAKLVMLLSSGSVEECCVCLNSMTLPVITRCAHVFCKTCISEVIENSEVNPTCPLCRRSISRDQLVDVPPEADDVDVERDDAMKSSTKVNALMCELLRLGRDEPDVKSLVVSQFTSFLKIIEKHLQKENIAYVIFHGGMTSAARNSALKQFETGKFPVMLLSLMAGGVGLNLTVASRVFLMEPAYNPAAEEQCFDRVHRLGQTKPVKIVKFICATSVEEKILDIQKVKRDLVSQSLKKLSSEERRERRVNDLRFLMSM